MAPAGLAILIGAGPNTGTGIARILSSPSHGNLAVALLARNPQPLENVFETVHASHSDAVLETFPTDTSERSLRSAFASIKALRGIEIVDGNIQYQA